MIPNNACTLCITAAAGTELAGASFEGTVNAVGYYPTMPSSLPTELYDPRAFITHTALLRQGFPHCAIFPTAASRRSLDRVSVPVWLIILSNQLPVFALVGHYPANKLMGRGLVSWHKASEKVPCFSHSIHTVWSYPELARVSPGCSRPEGRLSTCYSPVRRFTRPRRDFLARLACVRHAASVRSEPGSNSPVKFVENRLSSIQGSIQTAL